MISEETDDEVVWDCIRLHGTVTFGIEKKDQFPEITEMGLIGILEREKEGAKRVRIDPVFYAKIISGGRYYGGVIKEYTRKISWLRIELWWKVE